MPCRRKIVRVGREATIAFDHWWIAAFVDDVHCDLFEAEFAKAAESAVLSAKSQAALEAWRKRPSDFEQNAVIDDEIAARAHDFIWAFNLPGFDQLAAQFLTQRGRFSDFLAEETLFRMLTMARTTPVSILWHALGDQRASLLPGQMGNLLLRPDQIDEAAEMTRRAYAGATTETLLDAARRYCSTNVADDVLMEVLSFLPDGLARAKERQLGFLSLARPQI